MVVNDFKLSAVCLLESVGSERVRADAELDIRLLGRRAPTVGDISSRLTSGWNVGVGGEYHVNEVFGIHGDFGYYGLGVADQALHALQMPNGDAHLLSLTVGPVWHGGSGQEPRLLASCYERCMALAVEHRLRSIAFPGISTGAYGYPPEDAALIAVNTVRGALADAASLEEALGRN